ncbi:MAG: carbonic anhydrase, partial [Pseudomonadota bacterium]
MKLSRLMTIAWVLLAGFVLTTNIQAASKPPPEQVLQMLVEGNQRFAEGKSIHPHTGNDRLHQAGTQNQGDHAYATIISCSDSRVPVERIFDAGVMDIFTIRVAGNVVDTDEAGSIEYGLAHVHTPVMVVLGHTQCGAVTAVARSIHGKGHALEINIPPLVDNIEPAVKRAMAQHPGIHGDDIIPHAIVENVWQGVEDLFTKSPATRNLVNSGTVKVVGAIYNVGTGRVEWLPELPVAQILKKVEANPQRQLNAMAGGHGDGVAHTPHAGAASHAGVSQADREAVVGILRTLGNDHQAAATYQKKISDAGHTNTGFFILGLVVLLVSIGLTIFYARGKDEHGVTRLQKSLGAKLVASFSVIVLLLAGSAIYALVAISGIGDEIAELAEEVIPVTDRVSTVGTLMLEQAVNLERTYRFGEEAGAHAKEGFEKSVAAFEHFGKEVGRELAAGIKLLEELPAHNAEGAQTMVESLNALATINDHHHKYEILGLKVIELLKAGMTGQARLLEEAVEQAQDNLAHEIEAFVAEMHKRSEGAAHKAEMDEKRAAKIIWIISLMAVVAAFSIAVLNTRSIINPINRVIAGLNEGAEQVASASSQVSTASQSLAEGASEQAASIEETSSSLEEMSSMTRQNADNATQAD